MQNSSNNLKKIESPSSPTTRRVVNEFVRSAGSSVLANGQLVEGARQLLQARLKMGQLAPKGLFRDSAWDMLLELFISGEEGGIVYVKQLMIASGESSSAAMRKIDRLEDAGFIERNPDPLDQRRVIVRLTERGGSAMTTMLRHVFGPEPMPENGPVSFVPRSG